MDEELKAEDTNGRDTAHLLAEMPCISSYRGEDTYNTPTLNMRATPIFFFQCNCKFLS